MSYPQGCSDRGLGPGRKAIGNGGALNKQVPRGGRCFGGLPGRNIAANGTTLHVRVAVMAPRRTISLAFLSPTLVKAAIDGRLPRGFGVKRLMDLPMACQTNGRRWG
jgi:hypothetical protein